MVLLSEGGCEKQMKGCTLLCLVSSGPSLCQQKATRWPLLQPSCPAAQFRSPPDLPWLAPWRVCYRSRARLRALKAVACASFVSALHQAGGARGKVQAGPRLKPSIMSACPWRRIWACFVGQLFRQKSKPQPHLNRFPLLSPIGKPVTGLLGWAFCDRGGALSRRIARQGGLGAEAAPVLSNPGILGAQIPALCRVFSRSKL